MGGPAPRAWMLWDDLLEAVTRLAESRSLGERPPSPPRTTPSSRRDRLVSCLSRLRTGASQKGGAQTGKNPTDRGKSGSKHHVIVDRHGLPLAPPGLTASNVPDVVTLLMMVDRIVPVRGRRGRPRRRPSKLHADLGYRSRANIRGLRARGITPRIARKGIESRERLGRYRWVAERDLAWLHRFRRLMIRYERRADLHQGFLTLASILILWRAVTRLDE